MRATLVGWLGTLPGLFARLWDCAFGWQKRCPRCGAYLAVVRHRPAHDFLADELLFVCERCELEMPEPFWSLSGLND